MKVDKLEAADAERQKISAVKERLLEKGFMTIEPLEGDPFELSVLQRSG